MKSINKWYVGWSNYYSMTQYPTQLLSIEAHVRRRLRARVIDQQRRKRFLVNKLVAQGIKRTAAARTVYTNRRRWSLSASFVVQRAFPNKWFIQGLGQKIKSDQNLEHWFDLNRAIKVT